MRLKKLEGSVEDKRKRRKLVLDNDDPFSKVFLKDKKQDVQFEEKGRAKVVSNVKKQITRGLTKLMI